jgi:hypothetical protein
MNSSIVCFVITSYWERIGSFVRGNSGSIEATFSTLFTGSNKKLGRLFRELEPYALFPLDEYFNGPSIAGAGRPQLVASSGNRLEPPAEHLRFPLPVGKTA